jgi:ribosomal protein L11 methyltransferase
LIRLGVRVAREHADLVLAELLELAPGGVEERDVSADVVEYGVYGAEGELPALPALRAAAGGALVEVVTEKVADDWADRWRAFHRPVEIGGRLLVRPPWSPPASTGIVDLVIDPGQAFGTGAHPTTKLCLELMLGLEPGGAFMDLGCGSGVLAIAAARLGWGPVDGVDFDPLSVTATRENAQANGVEVSARRFDLLRDGPAPGAPTVAANLLRPLLLALARAGFRDPQPRTLVASGLLRREADEVSAALTARTGLDERARLEEGDWAALLLARPGAQRSSTSSG